MLHQEHMRTLTLQAIGVCAGLCIFAVTLLAYGDRQHAHLSGTYLPALTGAIAFAAVMVSINTLVLAVPRSVSQLLVALGLALVEAGIFVACLVFLLVRTFGA